MKRNEYVSIAFSQLISEALSDESDRACVILVAAWADHFLEKQLVQKFSKGNSKARSSLFSSNGPFSTFSGKLNTAFCAGWIDPDVYHDLQVVRKIRNEFAHSIGSHSLCDEPFSSMVAGLRVPKRQYHDWGDLRAASTDSGLVLYNGDRPDGAKEELALGKLTFRMGASVLFAVLIANLQIPVYVEEEVGMTLLELPEHMREIVE